MDDDIKTTTVEETAETDRNDSAGNGPESTDTSDPVAELQAKLNATHERLLRTAAELDNFRKRARREVEDAQNRGRGEVLAEILPAIDSVELALSSADSASEAASIVEGVQMIKRQFLSAVERFGVKSVESKGRSFDPNIHEAVAQIHSNDHPAGQIVEEMRKGYLLGEKLLRAAMVVVSKGAAPSGAEVPSSSEGASQADIGEGTGAEDSSKEEG